MHLDVLPVPDEDVGSVGRSRHHAPNCVPPIDKYRNRRNGTIEFLSVGIVLVEGILAPDLLIRGIANDYVAVGICLCVLPGHPRVAAA